jgi:hypothetical protein
MLGPNEAQARSHAGEVEWIRATALSESTSIGCVQPFGSATTPNT